MLIIIFPRILMVLFQVLVVSIAANKKSAIRLVVILENNLSFHFENLIFFCLFLMFCSCPVMYLIGLLVSFSPFGVHFQYENSCSFSVCLLTIYDFCTILDLFF